MDRTDIEREIRRLAPWYYDLELGGVRTTITAPFDDWGHRQLYFPPVRPGFWSGRTVLDVACNEGAWSFGARRAGAVHVDAFDVRPENIEKARFVQRVWGIDSIDFQVASCDGWLENHPGRQYDVVMLCGILYHLPEPWRTIEQYAAVARQRVFVSCVLYGGGEDGYTQYRELDNIGASENSLPSLMPNTVNTLLGEFAKHGFRPTHVQRGGYGAFGGGCYLLLESQREFPHVHVERETHSGADCEAYLAAMPVEEPGDRRQPFDVAVTLYNRAAGKRTLRATLRAHDRAGRILLQEGPLDVALDARVPKGVAAWNASTDHVARLELDGADLPVTVDVLLQELDGRVAAQNALRIDGR
ncbi:MAG: methyltransferase domain-containing protein [Planctomycetes bacterium]|nr:methyltransferase domain-containing protein [Planctomycetota bacterium]